MAHPVDTGAADDTASSRDTEPGDGTGPPRAPAVTSRPRLWPLYAGGFLGPFGGSMVSAMLPEIAEGLGTTVGASAWALTAYLIPFAGLMLVSGTMSERFGRRRTVLVAYLAYAGASLVCAVAPSLPLFLSGRVVQGAANAFTTPILIAAISDLVAPSRLGASLGMYGSLQAAGQSFAPLVGGVAAGFQWRWAFVGSLIASLALVTVLPADPPPSAVAKVGVRQEGRVRALLNRQLALASGVAFLVHSTTTGATVLVALLASDRFGLGPGQRGLVVAAFGAAGLLVGAHLGRVADRVGVRRFGVFAALALATGVFVAAFAPSLPTLVAAIAVAGAAATCARLAVTSLAVTSTPRNRGGATSIVLAFLFLGGAVSPVVWLPVYESDPTVGIAAMASGALAGAIVLATASGLARRSRSLVRGPDALTPEA